MTFRRSWMVLPWLCGLLLVAAPGGAGHGDPTMAPAAGAELARQAAVLDLAPEELGALRDACRAAGYTGEEFARLMTLVTRAKLAGLPHQQLLDKLDEGLAKRAMPERVLQALETRARRLQDAKAVVDQLIVQGWLAPDYPLAVNLVASALGAGATPAELVRSVRDGARTAAGVPDVTTAFVGLEPAGR